MDAVFSDYWYMAALPTGIPIGILEGFKKNLAVICYFMIEIVDATTFYLAAADDCRIL